ncbi:3-oxoacyl-ACP reductase [Halioglobus japonicus]|uniref:SDR family NAD(P)-dependent oxidoreductase n=1 Tax=Halioglobus japonicus TaxID=930805 RepID=A0AAP8SPA8_9GAMM|nr:SDR family oxidoreductase [Halioglobus japonicus]AQA19556.1 3-oxoacyl-ACP reductase [Halioglobus japonicus]PLW87376.1 SDR family NAD(P)-dependent oxidoreductase [Halioglobus japonicus]GHD08797.1 3-oxoacyl-ACP reductase [Halioglobus japonicus]
MNNTFQEKVILITGAAGGFGQILAQKTAARGARLVLGDLDLDALEALAAPLRDSGADVATARCDVSNEADVAALVALATAEFGQLDIAVNNAGISGLFKPLIEIDEAEFDTNLAVNAKGVFFGIKHEVLQMLKQDGGIILNVASMAGLGAAPMLGAYAAAKHAVVGLTKTAAVEYADKNIRVNAICPFFSPTPMVTSMADEGMQGMLAKRCPMKRLGSPEEMVDVMITLIDPNNSYMTGQTIAVDGGTSAF